MKQIIYKEVIEIDGREYTVVNCDYSDCINELITDQIIPDNNHDIVDYITDDIVNSQ